MSDLQTQFDNLINEQQKLKQQFQGVAQELFRKITKEFFEKNPGITAIKWSQYTPYFNDGDTCEFSVNSPTFTNAPEDELEFVNYGEYEGETEGIWATDSMNYVLGVVSTGRDYYKDTRDAILAGATIDKDSCENFSHLIQTSEMEDVMMTMFGDHVQVIATANGFEVDEYDHD